MLNTKGFGIKSTWSNKTTLLPSFIYGGGASKTLSNSMKTFTFNWTFSVSMLAWNGVSWVPHSWRTDVGTFWGLKPIYVNYIGSFISLLMKPFNKNQRRSIAHIRQIPDNSTSGGDRIQSAGIFRIEYTS